jgi:hypothetical protein
LEAYARANEGEKNRHGGAGGQLECTVVEPSRLTAGYRSAEPGISSGTGSGSASERERRAVPIRASSEGLLLNRCRPIAVSCSL